MSGKQMFSGRGRLQQLHGSREGSDRRRKLHGCTRATSPSAASRDGTACRYPSCSRGGSCLSLGCSAKLALVVPVVVSPEPEVAPNPAASMPPKPRKRRRRGERASIELEIDGVVVRVGRDTDANAIPAVVGALKADS